MFNIYKYIEYNMYHMIYLFIKTIITYFIYFNGVILNLLSTIFMVFYYGLLNEQLQLFATGWVIMELINWMIYLFMYMKIIDPVLLCLNKQDINKIINRIDKLNKSDASFTSKLTENEELSHNRMATVSERIDAKKDELKDKL